MRDHKLIYKLDKGGSLEFDSRSPYNLAALRFSFDSQGNCYVMQHQNPPKTELVYGLGILNLGFGRVTLRAISV